jgi:tetratricopeptide (TPR) repeat protein
VGSIDDLDWSIGCNPNFADAYYYRSIGKSELKDHQGALIDSAEAARLNPENIHFKIGYAINFLNIGDRLNAKIELKPLAESGNLRAIELIQKYSL